MESDELHPFQYAAFVKNIFSMNVTQNIQEFCSICNQYKISTGNQLELLFQFYQAGNDITFGEEKFFELNQNPIILQYVISQPEGLEWVIGLCFESDDFIKDNFYQVINNLPNNLLIFLKEVLYKKTKDCIKKQSINDLKKLLDKIWKCFPVGTDVEILQKLIVELTPNNNNNIEQIQSYPWGLRSFLIKKWSEHKSIYNNYQNFFKLWLLVTPEEIPFLFSFPIHKNTLTLAVISYFEKYGISKIPFSEIHTHNLGITIIEYFYDNTKKETALTFFHLCHKNSIKEKNFISSKLLIQMINNKKTITMEGRVDVSRLNFIKKMTSFMEDLSEHEIFQIFKSNILHINSLEIILFLLKYMGKERAIKIWILTFLKKPNADWIMIYDYKVILNILYNFILANKNIYSNTEPFITYIQRWKILFQFLSSDINKISETELDQIEKLIQTIFNKFQIKNANDLKKIIIERLALRLIDQSSSKSEKKIKNYKKLYKNFINYIGVAISGSELQFLFDLTDAFLKNYHKFINIDNIDLIERHVINISRIGYLNYCHEQEVVSYLKKIFDKIITQNNSKLTSSIEKRISKIGDRINLWDKCKTRKK